MAEHSHLDQQRRAPGECPACDIAWQRQTARLTAATPSIRAVQQVERLAERPKPLPVTFCKAMFDGPVGDRDSTHTCCRPADHPGKKHLCPLCDLEW